MYNDLMPKTAIAMAAFFWGLSCFFPVGMSYLAAFVLILAIMVQGWHQHGEYGVRWQQVRQHAAFWPLCFYVAWTFVILGMQPRYPETPSNLFHGLRIVLTISVVLMLKRDELRAGLLGWIVGSVFALTVIYVNAVIPLPRAVGLRDLLLMHNNKSIGIAILLGIFASCTWMYSLMRPASKTARFSALSILLVVPALIWFLPSRTSLILIVVALFVGLIHAYWKKPTWLAMSIAVLMIAGYGIAQTPQIQQRFKQGFIELEETDNLVQSSSTDWQDTSWGMRYMLYKHTTNMMLEKPLTGWGIGSWNDQWRKRTPTSVHAANMPHNDFLWMGAQAGVPGLLALLAMMLSLFINVMRFRGVEATCSMMGISGLFIAMSLNSALRDAQIGMSVLFVVVVLNAWALSSNKPKPGS